jgi:hypothetical protein
MEVSGELDTNVSEDRAASIFRVEVNSGYGGRTALRNVDIEPRH